jgi:hypothetical protein
MTWHRDQTLANVPNLPPFRMILYREGSTGKYTVIQSMTDAFAERSASGLLLKASYTGVTASLIQGKTLHSIGKIRTDKQGNISLSDDVKEKLQKFWNTHTYLIIDEHLMISKSFLAKLSYHIGRVWMESQTCHLMVSTSSFAVTSINSHLSLLLTRTLFFTKSCLQSPVG